MSEVRGTGYFYAIELTASREKGIELTEDQTNTLVNDHMPGLISDAGLLIRSDARGAPKLVLSPPLIATREELDELVAGVDQILARAAELDLA